MFKISANGIRDDLLGIHTSNWPTLNELSARSRKSALMESCSR